jgi:UPF0042 nucleotide-binding protein
MPMAQASNSSRLIIVTGVSGSGRSSALRVLEDLGFYCVDNLPVGLAMEVMRLTEGRDPTLAGVALGVDPRERMFFLQWPRIFADLERNGIYPEVIFLDASDEVLARRYSETRRPHPMAESGLTVAEGLHSERLALAELRDRANRIIDTTTLTIHELREVVTSAVLSAATRSRMAISIASFGYKYGVPVGMDIVLDVRFLPNPFFVAELKHLDGHDIRVHEFVMAEPEARRFLDEVVGLLEFLLPLYQREGKSYLMIGLGCTGGRHRSPVLARELAERLLKLGFESTVRDHHIKK